MARFSDPLQIRWRKEDEPLMFNALDFLLIFFLVVGALWGLLRGAGKLLIGLFSLYVGLVVTLWLYRPLADFFRDLLPGMSVRGSQVLAFVILLFVLVNGIGFFTRFFATPPEERKRKQRGDLEEAVSKGGQRFITGPLNQLVGLVLGIVVAIIWISLILAVLQFILRSGFVTGSGAGAFQRQINTSVLIPWFAYTLTLIYSAISFWIPGDAPNILSGLMEQLQ
jgi:uncharacterized membrane protein required for colicin V production